MPHGRGAAVVAQLMHLPSVSLSRSTADQTFVMIS
jgi:hypothetical protein